MTETGWFRTAFAMPGHLNYAENAEAAGQTGRSAFQLLGDALDALVRVGVLPPQRRPDLEFVVWASVHGMAVLATQGPLREFLPARRDELFTHTLAYIRRAL